MTRRAKVMSEEDIARKHNRRMICRDWREDVPVEKGYNYRNGDLAWDCPDELV